MHNQHPNLISCISRTWRRSQWDSSRDADAAPDDFLRISSAKPNEASAGKKAWILKRPLPSLSTSLRIRARLWPNTAYVPTDSPFSDIARTYSDLSVHKTSYLHSCLRRFVQSLEGEHSQPQMIAMQEPARFYFKHLFVQSPSQTDSPALRDSHNMRATSPLSQAKPDASSSFRLSFALQIGDSHGSISKSELTKEDKKQSEERGRRRTREPIGGSRHFA